MPLQAAFFEVAGHFDLKQNWRSRRDSSLLKAILERSKTISAMPVSRRKALKTLGAATGAALLGHFPTGLDSRTPLSFFEENPLYKSQTGP
ncbi:MAG TPA: twin-arginine translocation signal domain-containing protein [Saprospiraceae bacterium]|nr:twin-arginine translocation signal domain-containing protein [Saprospiraceae bacterium]